jgi:hypothetical protein
VGKQHLGYTFCFSSKQQASNTRTAEGPHGQATFLDFSWAMQTYRGPAICSQFYEPNVNHSNHFLFVLNRTATHEYSAAIDWNLIK